MGDRKNAKGCGAHSVRDRLTPPLPSMQAAKPQDCQCEQKEMQSICLGRSELHFHLRLCSENRWLRHSCVQSQLKWYHPVLRFPVHILFRSASIQPPFHFSKEGRVKRLAF